MQPVQDLTIDATVSSGQYQFALQDANPDELALWVPRLVERLRRIPLLEDVSTSYTQSGLGGLCSDRSRDRGAVRDHAGDDRQRAL